MGKYAKAIQSVILATMIALIPIVQAGPVTVASKLMIAVALLSAVMVYLVPNVSEVPALKTIAAAVMAGVAFLVTAVSTDCPSLLQIFYCVALVNWIQCGIMVLKAANVYIVPNAKESD